MLASDVVALYRALDEAHAPAWVIGGWGVDALLGEQTRPHHDLDVLVDVADLERLRLCLRGLGFPLAYLWDDEVWWISDDAWESPLEQPSAFVCAHPDGREVDVHVLRLAGDGSVETLWSAPYGFTSEGLSATGAIGGVTVRCLSREMQLSAHSGYELPPHHLRDVELLRGLRA